MALGLNGHLSNLMELNTYEYLIKCHEMTSVGLLLGVAATKRGEIYLLCHSYILLLYMRKPGDEYLMILQVQWMLLLQN